MAIYLSAAEYIKERPFNVWAQAYYQPHLPKEMLEKPKPLGRINRWKMTPVNRRSPAPFRQVVDPAQMQLCSYTIEIMLDMFQKNVEFELADEDDIPEIFDNVDRYLLTLETDIVMGIEWAIAYAKLAIKWREELYKHYFRYMKTHEGALALLYPNNHQKKNLLSLLSMASGLSTEQRNLDPLRARSFPPYDVEAIRPKDEEEAKKDMFDGGLVLGADNLLADTGKDFDFEDFLSRKG